MSRAHNPRPVPRKQEMKLQTASPGRMRTAFIALTALVIALVIATIACSGESPPPPVTTPIPATDGATPQPGATPADTGAISPVLAAFLADVDSKISAIRGIPVAAPVPFRFLNERDMNAYIREQIDDEETVREIELADGIYTLLGLIPPDAVLFDEYAGLLDSQVLGAYDPEVEEFVVLQKGDDFGPLQEFTYAHEYVHRLQDARFGLDEISDRLKENSDRSLAFTALVEGDATTSQQIYALQNLDFAQLAQILAESGDAIERANDVPYILRRGLEFPYIEGASFVDRLRTTQGLASINDAFLEPPDSTEQVLHIEKYVSRELPVEVRLPETLFGPDGPAGPEWETVDTDVFGEFFLRSWLEAIGARRTDAAEAAAGWGGDAHRLAVNGEGDYALALKVVWDDPDTDAEQFFLLLTTVMAASPEFRRLDIGPNAGVAAYDGAGGVIVASTLSNAEAGRFTVVAAAPELGDAMALMLALAG